MNKLFVATVFCLCVASTALHGQDSVKLSIKSVDITNFPVVYLKVEISRNGNVIKQFDVSNFNLFENKVGQLIESLVCPGDSSTRLSVALLLDRSGSMGLKPGTTNVVDTGKIVAAKNATRRFIEFLDPRDEACIYSFASTDVFQGYTFFINDQNFTHDTSALKGSLDPIKPLGGTWIWRAMLRTIDSLKSRAGRPFLVVLTDGRSMGEEPQYTYQMVITAALKYKIPVYIIGLGSDVDESKLRSISNSTGGKYYRSPDATTLEQIFRQLAAEIITDACLLRYTSTNPCLDGSRRLVEVEVHAPGPVYDEDSISFVVPRQLSPVTLAVGTPQEIPSRTTFRVPILVQEFLSTLTPMTYAFSVQYDPAVLSFSGVLSNATMSQGGIVDVVQIAPGIQRLSMINQLPYLSTGTLVDVEFNTLGTPDSIATAIRLRDASLSQQCPTEVTTNDGSMTVLPCEAVYSIGNRETFIVQAGETLSVPIRIRPSIPAFTKYVMNVSVRYKESDLEYIGIDSSGTLSEAGTILVTKAKDMLALTLRGVTADTADHVVNVLFYAHPRKNSISTGIEVYGSDIRTDCRVVAQSENPTILINGACEQILVKPVNQSLSNHPNPFFKGKAAGGSRNAMTRLTFAVTEEHSYVRVSVMDATGKEIAVPVDGVLNGGTYSYDFNAAGLPAGTYFALLSTPRGKTVHPMILLR